MPRKSSFPSSFGSSGNNRKFKSSFDKRPGAGAPRKNKKSKVNVIRGLMYSANKVLGDVQAVTTGKVAGRIERRMTGKVAAKGLGSNLFKFFQR